MMTAHPRYWLGVIILVAAIGQPLAPELPGVERVFAEQPAPTPLTPELRAKILEA